MHGLMDFINTLTSSAYFTDMSFLIVEMGLLLAFLSSNLIFIRFLTMITDVCFITIAQLTGFSVPGMTTTALMGAASLMINSYKIFQYYRMMSNSSIKKEFLSTYESTFSVMKPYQFNSLLNYASDETFIGTILKKGDTFKKLFFIVAGAAHVTISEDRHITLNEHQWIGELSFLADQNISRDVTLEDDTKLLTFTKDSLHALKEKEEEIYVLLESIITKNICYKLLETNKLLEQAKLT